jgi:hypothetical protein
MLLPDLAVLDEICERADDLLELFRVGFLQISLDPYTVCSAFSF